jgi:hypothetical protein
MPNPGDSLPDAPPAAGSAAPAPWADLPDAPGGAPAVDAPAQPQLSGGSGVAAMMGARPPMQVVAETPPEQSAQRLRTMAEVGIPLAAGALLGPEMIPPARAGVTGLAAAAPAIQALLVRMGLMGTAGVAGSELGQVLGPTDEDPAARRETAFTLNAAGEPLGAAASTAAHAMVPPARKFAEEQAAKALGFLYSTLRLAGRDEARRVGRVALDEDVIRGLGLASHETLLGRAEGVQDVAGKTLGEIRAEVDQLGAGTSTDDIVAEIRRVLGDEIVPGEADEALLRGHLDRTTQDVEAYAREGARNAPVVGPEGDRALWEMTPRDVQSSVVHAPSRPEGFLPGLEIEQAAHLEEVVRALRAGQQVPPEVLEAMPELAALFPENMNASALAELKRTFARRAYGETGRVPETLMGEFAPRTEAARAVVQGAEDDLVARLRPERADEFQDSKDIYGAMERLVDPKHGVTEAAASRALGNNQVFGLSSQLAGLAGRTPLEGGLGMMLTKLLWGRGNQMSALASDRLAQALGQLTPERAAVLARVLMQSAGQAGRPSPGEGAPPPPLAP